MCVCEVIAAAASTYAPAAAVVAAAAVPAAAALLQLEADMKTCAPLGGSSRDDLMVLQSNLMGNVQGTVQYNGQGR